MSKKHRTEQEIGNEIYVSNLMRTTSQSSLAGEVTAQHNDDAHNNHGAKYPYCYSGKVRRKYRKWRSSAGKSLGRMSSCWESWHALVKFPSLKESPVGWATCLTLMSSVVLAYEIRLQRILSCPPMVFVQGVCNQNSMNSSTMLRLKNLLMDATASNGDNSEKLSDSSVTFKPSTSMDHIISISPTQSSHNKASDSSSVITSKVKRILSRNIRPSLFFTSSLAASLGAYLFPGPADQRYESSFREYLKMGHDGAVLALDWELPLYHSRFRCHSSSSSCRIIDRYDLQSMKQMILHGPIELDVPIILILHGINNDSSFGYVRSLKRACTDRGWVTCAINFRGCGNDPHMNATSASNASTTDSSDTSSSSHYSQLDSNRHCGLRTPRAYHAGYTNDLRTIVHCIAHRCTLRHSVEKLRDGKETQPLNHDSLTPIVLVGNSLGANIMTKYLGEEGLDETLPPNVVAGISRGNPLEINGANISSPWAELLALGVKKSLLFDQKNRQAITSMSDPHFQRAIWRAFFTSATIGNFDKIMAPFMIRNEPIQPFSSKIGFKDGEEYWEESSSRKFVANVSVPLLILSSLDDFLVTEPALRSLNQCLSNPNVMVVKTKCGGHLGWQEAAPDGYFGVSSFADAVTVEFIDAVLQEREERRDCSNKEETRKDQVSQEVNRASLLIRSRL